MCFFIFFSNFCAILDEHVSFSATFLFFAQGFGSLSRWISIRKIFEFFSLSLIWVPNHNNKMFDVTNFWSFLGPNFFSYATDPDNTGTRCFRFARNLKTSSVRSGSQKLLNVCTQKSKSRENVKLTTKQNLFRKNFPSVFGASRWAASQLQPPATLAPLKQIQLENYRIFHP